MLKDYLINSSAIPRNLILENFSKIYAYQVSPNKFTDSLTGISNPFKRFPSVPMDADLEFHGEKRDPNMNLRQRSWSYGLGNAKLRSYVTLH